MSMPNSRKIQELQNEEENLIIQASSGHYYNLAEGLNYICWILWLVSAIISFKSGEIVFSVVMVILDVIAVILGILVRKYTKEAADLRWLFDNRVLFNDDKMIESDDIKRITELALNYSYRHNTICQQQIRNNGTDNPPGKRDWYVFTRDYDVPVAQVECIEQNKWWRTKLFNYGYGIFAIIFIIIIAIVITEIIGNPKAYPLSGIINAFAMLLFRLGERMQCHIKYTIITIKEEATLDIVREKPSVYGIRKCMDYLNEYRHIPVFGVNLIYRVCANRLSDVYQRLSNK